MKKQIKRLAFLLVIQLVIYLLISFCFWDWNWVVKVPETSLLNRFFVLLLNVLTPVYLLGIYILYCEDG